MTTYNDYVASHAESTYLAKAVKANISLNTHTSEITVGNHTKQLSSDQIAGFATIGVYFLLQKSEEKLISYLDSGMCGKKMGDTVSTKKKDIAIPETVQDLSDDALLNILGDDTFKMDLSAAEAVQFGVDRLPHKAQKLAAELLKDMQKKQEVKQMLQLNFAIDNLLRIEISDAGLTQYVCYVPTNRIAKVASLIEATAGWEIASYKADGFSSFEIVLEHREVQPKEAKK